MVAFSIALAASVLFICIANTVKRYIDYKYNKDKHCSDTYLNKLNNIDKLCIEITDKALAENEKNGYFPVSNYENLVANIRYIINFK